MKLTDEQRRHRQRAIRALIHGSHGSESPQVKSDINVTPLVDVVLVLLIIFMVVTPMIASGVAVDLPRTLNHSRKPDDGKDIIISVTHDRRVFVGAKPVHQIKDLGRVVTEERRRSPDKSIFMKADARAPFGAVREAMDALNEAEIEDVYLGTEELEKTGQE